MNNKFEDFTDDVFVVLTLLATMGVVRCIWEVVDILGSVGRILGKF